MSDYDPRRRSLSITATRDAAFYGGIVTPPEPFSHAPLLDEAAAELTRAIRLSDQERQRDPYGRAHAAFENPSRARDLAFEMVGAEAVEEALAIERELRAGRAPDEPPLSEDERMARALAALSTNRDGGNQP